MRLVRVVCCGPVSVLVTQTNGNSGPGVRVEAAAGSVLVRGAEFSYGLARGIEIDAAFESGLAGEWDAVVPSAGGK